MLSINEIAQLSDIEIVAKKMAEMASATRLANETVMANTAVIGQVMARLAKSQAESVPVRPASAPTPKSEPAPIPEPEKKRGRPPLTLAERLKRQGLSDAAVQAALAAEVRPKSAPAPAPKPAPKPAQQAAPVRPTPLSPLKRAIDRPFSAVEKAVFPKLLEHLGKMPIGKSDAAFVASLTAYKAERGYNTPNQNFYLFRLAHRVLK